MLGWSIRASACRSASKRAITCRGVHPRLDDLQGHLAADRLRSARPRRPTPMPPSPICSSSLYGPMTVPGPRAGDGPESARRRGRCRRPAGRGSSPARSWAASSASTRRAQRRRRRRRPRPGRRPGRSASAISSGGEEDRLDARRRARSWRTLGGTRAVSGQCEIPGGRTAHGFGKISRSAGRRPAELVVAARPGRSAQWRSAVAGEMPEARRRPPRRSGRRSSGA